MQGVRYVARSRVLLVVCASLFSAFAALLTLFLSPVPVHAATGINSQLSFSGKVVKSDGTNIADGTYNMEFKIYQDGTGTSGGGGTLKWTEDRLIGGSGGVTISSGTFTVNLGSVNTTLGTAVDFNQNTLWLSMQVGNASGCTITTTFQANCGGDGEMSPYIRLTAAPYALNAGLLNGIAASSFVQLSPSLQQTGNINVSGNVTSGGSVQAASASFTGASSLSLGTAGTTAGKLAVASAGGGSVSLTAGSLAAGASYTLTLPTGVASSGQCLAASDNSGTLGWNNCITSGVTAANNGLTVNSGSVGLGGTLSTGTTTLTSGDATSQIALSSGTNTPTMDQMTIDNTASSGVATAGVNGLSIKYKGGSAAVESAGMRIDYTPGTTSGGTWSGMRIVAGANGAASGVTAYGIKLEGPTTAGAGTDEGLYVGTGWDVGLDLASGGIQMAAQSDPATPAAGTLRFYAKTIAGRTMPKWIGPYGVDTPVQASFGFNRIAMMAPAGNGTTATTIMNSWGTAFTDSASTYANPALASTNLNTSVRKARLTSATNSTTAIVYHAPAALMAWRGNAAGLGGFFFTTRFSFATLNTGNVAFIGLADTTTAPTSVNPTTSTTYGKLGIGIATNTGNLKWVNNVSGTAPTATDLGTNFTVNTTDLYELIIYSPPNGSAITYRVKNLSTGNVTADTSVSTNIPVNTTFLAPMYWMADSSTTGAVAIDNAGWYLESDN